MYEGGGRHWRRQLKSTVMGSCMSTSNGDSEGSAGLEPLKREIDSEAAEALIREAKNDEQLACLEGRMCINGATDVASIYSQQGKKGTNQDAMIVWENFGSQEDTVFCGVFDGHGPYGHLVGRRVRNSLPCMLINQWQELLSTESFTSDGNESEVIDMTKSSDDSDLCSESESKMFATWKESHLRAFKVMDKELKLHPTLDCCCSGTTAVTIVKQGRHLVIGNVGDSRAVLGTKSNDGNLMAIQLTVDLKPNLSQEAERIQQCKGRVFALQDEPGVYRVWLPDDDSPGLAMARAFGDFCLKDFGVIAVPEVTHRYLTSKDQFVVLATDGVWDVLTNKEVVHIVSSASTRASAARMVVETAVRAWRHKYPTSKVDDCAVVCLFLDSYSFIPEHESHKSLSFTVDDIVVQASEEVLAVEQSNTTQSSSITNTPDQSDKSNKLKNVKNDGGKSQQSFAERLVTEEWFALDGLTRVNSLLSLPRFFMGDRKVKGTKSRR